METFVPCLRIKEAGGSMLVSNKGDFRIVHDHGQIWSFDNNKESVHQEDITTSKSMQLVIKLQNTWSKN